MEYLSDFVKKITEFELLKPSQKIQYFAYSILTVKKKDFFTAKDIEDCFKELHIAPYSNIAKYLSEKSKGKTKIFIKQKVGYTIERSCFMEIKENIGELIPVLKPSNNLFPAEILFDTRDYLEKIGAQSICCYDNGLYDASLVMLRKLLESLIIELYEKHRISDKIKNPRTGHFYYLSDLIDNLLKETTWNLSRNIQKSLPLIKKIGDLSAHNRFFIAKKSDIDPLKFDIRITIEELILKINFSNTI